MAWKASWAHRTGENENKDNDKIKKSRSKRRAPVVYHPVDKINQKIHIVSLSVYNKLEYRNLMIKYIVLVADSRLELY